MDSCIPLPIDEATLNDVVEKAKDWALMHGAAMRPKNNYSQDSLQVIAKHFAFFHIFLQLQYPQFSFYYVLVCTVHFIAYFVSSP